MRKILNPKIIIPVAVLVLLLGFVGYILFAPSTWWKPFYVKMEMDGATTASEAQAAELPSQPGVTTQPGGMPPAQPGGMPTQNGNYQQASTIQQQPGIMYTLDNKVVNLAEPGGLRYLQAAVVLELWPIDQTYFTLEGEERDQAEDDFIDQIDKRRPIIDDIVTTILSSKTFNEVATVDGKTALKEELMTAINDALGYQGVTNVYFTSFVVQ
jgi:flagellar FliL protein